MAGESWSTLVAGRVEMGLFGSDDRRLDELESKVEVLEKQNEMLAELICILSDATGIYANNDENGQRVKYMFKELRKQRSLCQCDACNCFRFALPRSVCDQCQWHHRRGGGLQAPLEIARNALALKTRARAAIYHAAGHIAITWLAGNHDLIEYEGKHNGPGDAPAECDWYSRFMAWSETIDLRYRGDVDANDEAEDAEEDWLDDDWPVSWLAGKIAEEIATGRTGAVNTAEEESLIAEYILSRLGQRSDEEAVVMALLRYQQNDQFDKEWKRLCDKTKASLEEYWPVVEDIATVLAFGKYPSAAQVAEIASRHSC
jgi:hypothetical protein